VGGTDDLAAGSGGTLERLVRPAAGEPQGALVLLHGRGADEHDLFPLLDLLDPARRLLGVSPRAPLSLPPGGAHWYRLGGIPTPDPETFLASARLLAALVDALPVPIDRVVLGGFSQGCVMTWATALGPGRPRPAGVIGMSGFLPRVPEFALELGRAEGLPVAVAHGALDPVIPALFGIEAANAMEAAGADLTRLETPAPHTVDPAWLGPLRALVDAAIP
jgi:phospholipase/carboxylesterase